MCRNLIAAQFQAPLNGFAEPEEEGAKHGFFIFGYHSTGSGRTIFIPTRSFVTRVMKLKSYIYFVSIKVELCVI